VVGWSLGMLLLYLAVVVLVEFLPARLKEPKAG